MQRSNSKTIQEMDVKKNRSSASTSNTKSMDRRKAVEFVGDVKQELKRIEWTKKDELQSYTKIVLAGIFLFGMLVYLIDLIIQGFLGGIHLIVKLITG